MDKFVKVNAGIALWGTIRDLATSAGLSVEESRGLLRRNFVLRGSDDALRGFLAAAKHHPATSSATPMEV